MRADLESLRLVAQALPVGTAVPVPREWLLELLDGQGSTAAPDPIIPPADFTVADLALRFGRSTSTIRGWLDRGHIDGAYRFQRREWRVPAAALAAFEARQRAKRPGEQIAPPRAAGGRPVDLGAWREAS